MKASLRLLALVLLIVAPAMLWVADSYAEGGAPAGGSSGTATEKPIFPNDDMQVNLLRKHCPQCDGRGMVASLIDTGFHPEHPEFALSPEAWKVRRFKSHAPGMTDKIPYGYPAGERGFGHDADYSHGAGTSSVLAGSSAGGGRFDGMAPGAQLLNFAFMLPVMNDNIRNGIDTSRELDADVISASLGFNERAVDGHEWNINAAIKRAKDRGIPTFVSAGNDSIIGNKFNHLRNVLNRLDNGTMIDFALEPDALAVGATSISQRFGRPDATPVANEPMTFTSWGTNNSLDFKPFISGVGNDVEAARFSTGYWTQMGTSFATPTVAGAALLMLQKLTLPDAVLPHATKVERMNSTLVAMSNTAKVLKDPYTHTPYSPRQMGAGLVQIYDASRTGVLARVDDKPHVALREVPLNTSRNVNVTLN